MEPILHTQDLPINYTFTSVWHPNKVTNHMRNHTLLYIDMHLVKQENLLALSNLILIGNDILIPPTLHSSHQVYVIKCIII